MHRFAWVVRRTGCLSRRYSGRWVWTEYEPPRKWNHSKLRSMMGRIIQSPILLLGDIVAYS